MTTTCTNEPTPGPWAAKSLGNGNYMIIAGPEPIEERKFSRVNDLVLGSAYERDDDVRLPAEANARLFASARALLAACEAAYEVLQTVQLTGRLPMSHAMIHHGRAMEAEEALLTAIKKARGQGRDGDDL